MINTSDFLNVLEQSVGDFVTGVPDSQLKEFCIEVFNRYGVGNNHHIVAVNEGNAVGLAAGYNLATGKVPVVYLQNSGLGNTVNPVTSLSDSTVFGIPIVFIVGWRGEPDVHDEPEHTKMGEITTKLLDLLGIRYMILDKDSCLDSVKRFINQDWPAIRDSGKIFAFVVKKGAFEKSGKSFPIHKEQMEREYAICRFADVLSNNDYVVSSTGKISRELYEHVKKTNPEMVSHDFLMIGSMGHADMIALNIALRKKEKTIWCFDGDGAILMHMGSLATIGTLSPGNFLHVLFNNEAHESVGGMPTIAGKVDLSEVAKTCGYKTVMTLHNQKDLDDVLPKLRNVPKPVFIQVMVSTGSRTDLIRPDRTPQENKKEFMESLSE